MNNLWWPYTTCTLIPMQELRGEEGGGLIIHGGRIIRLYGITNGRRHLYRAIATVLGRLRRRDR